MVVLFFTVIPIRTFMIDVGVFTISLDEGRVPFSFLIDHFYVGFFVEL